MSGKNLTIVSWVVAVLVLWPALAVEAGAASLVLDPGPGTDYLGIWCGGQRVNEFATGFDDAGNATTLVQVTTTCPGSGRSSPNQYYKACWTVTFDEDGAILSKESLSSSHWVQGNPSVPCPVPVDAQAVYTFTDGAGNFAATLSTQSIGASSPVDRAVLETACTPVHDGDTVNGSLSGPGENACFSFRASAGDVVEVSALATGGSLVPEARMVRPDGTTLCGPGSGIVNCDVDAPGRHIVLLNDHTGTETGSYSLTVGCLTDTCLPFDYALGNSGRMVLNPGAAGSNLITTTPAVGVMKNVTLVAGGLPSGATGFFNKGGCNPDCTSRLTIKTLDSTPVGTYPVTITGTPRGRTTTFDLVVTKGTVGGCPATMALTSAPSGAMDLKLLYDVRDQILTASPGGKRTIDLYYKHATEAAWLMLQHPDLLSRSRALVESLVPVLRTALAGQPLRPRPGDLDAIDALLAAFRADASPGMQADIDVVRKELQQPGAPKKFGFSR